MVKFKAVFVFIVVLLIVSSVTAETNTVSSKPLFVSFNGRYTNFVYGSKINLWKEKDKFTFEEIQTECENQPENPDVWYIAGYYWQHIINNRKKAGECYKKSTELAPTAFIPHNSFVETLRRVDGAEILCYNLSNLVYKIKSLREMLKWSWGLISFRNDDTNQLEKLYFLIEENKNKIPSYNYALGICAMQAEKYDIAFKHFDIELEETKNRTVKLNILDKLNFCYEYADNSKLMAKRDEILKKYLSPYKYAVQKIENIQPKHNNPELYILTSNAFELAGNQWERIIAIHDLAVYCKKTYRKETKNFIDRITDGKYVDPGGASMLIRNMNTINATKNLHSYCERVIEKMPENLNTINNFINSVHNDNSNRKRPEADKFVLNLIVKKFSDNFFIINSVAKEYGEYGCYNEELNCREKMLTLANNKDLISKTKARITELKLKLGQTVDREEVFAENLKNAKRNAAAAIVISKIYLKTGKTNDALDILMNCVENTDFPNELRPAAEAVLNTDWGMLEEKAFDSLLESVKNNCSDINYFAGKIMWKYLNTGFEEKAIDTFIFIAKDNIWPYKYEKIITRFNANLFVDKIISEEVTNNYILVGISGFLRNENKKSLAYKLRNYFINLDGGNYRKYDAAAAMLKYAYDKGDTNLCFEIIGKIDGFVKQKIVPKNLHNNLYRYMLKLNLTNKCNLWVEFMLKKTSNKQLTKNLYSYSKWYMHIGKTNKLKNLIAKNCNTNLPIHDMFELLKLFVYTGETNQYKLYIDTIGARLTNARLINIHGWSYLSQLNYLFKLSGKSYDERINDLFRKWLHDNKVSINIKFSILRHIKSNQVEYVNYIAKNKNNFDSDQMMNVAGMYINYGITNRGIEFYSCVMDNPESDNYNKINAILKLVNIYLDNEDYQSAVNMLNKFSQINLDKQYIGFFSNLGALYVRAFMYVRAVDCYIYAINRTERISNVENAVMKIADAWHNDSEIKYSKLAEINFTNKNECLNYTAKGLFLLLDNNVFEAEKLIYKAEEKLKTNNDKFNLWKAWKNVAQINNNYEALILANKKMLHYSENQYYKDNFIYDINRLLRITTNYMEIIYFNSNLLNDVTNERRYDEIILNIFDAYLGLADTNSAWETVLQVNSAETIKRLAFRINKRKEMMQEFERRIVDSNGRNFIIMATSLSQNNLNNKELLEKLAYLLDVKISEFNVRDYANLSMIYLKCGYEDKAKTILQNSTDINR